MPVAERFAPEQALFILTLNGSQSVVADLFFEGCTFGIIRNTSASRHILELEVIDDDGVVLLNAAVAQLVRNTAGSLRSPVIISFILSQHIFAIGCSVYPGSSWQFVPAAATGSGTFVPSACLYILKSCIFPEFLLAQRKTLKFYLQC